MGRWTFEGGRPLYIPDPGEEGGGSMIGHLASGVGQTMGDIFGGLQTAGDALAESGVGKALQGPVGAASDYYKSEIAPQHREMMGDLGIPGRALVAGSTAATDAVTGSKFMGDADPLEYTFEGEGDLAHAGDLLADTMEAEGTVNEQGIVSKAVRGAGNLFTDPLFLFGVARSAAKMLGGGRPVPPNTPAGPSSGRMPRSKLSPDQPRPMDSTPGQTGAGPQFPKGGKGGGAGMETGEMGWTQVAPKKLGKAADTQGLRRNLMGQAEDAPIAEIAGPGGGGVAGGPGSPKPKPTRYRHPPVDPEDAARFPSAPLDTDIASPGAFTGGGVRTTFGGRAPKGAKAARKADRRGRAREMGREEQLQEGVGRMRQEQLGQGVSRMQEQEMGMRPGAMGPEATQPIWLQQNTSVPPAGSAGSSVVPRDALRAMLQSAVENGASADDVMALLTNLRPGNPLNPGL
jgi:hypothetical protein